MGRIGIGKEDRDWDCCGLGRIWIGRIRISKKGMGRICIGKDRVWEG